MIYASSTDISRSPVHRRPSAHSLLTEGTHRLASGLHVGHVSRVAVNVPIRNSSGFLLERVKPLIDVRP